MRIIIIANRSPISIAKKGNGYSYKESSGGLASGLRAYVSGIKKTDPDTEIIWVGWPGATVDDEQQVSKELVEKFNVHSIFMSELIMENFYEGFCNNTIWPLFHYFPGYTVYNKEFWEEYVEVNKRFCEKLLSIYQPGDILWVHDYHLMLLPALIRKEIPDATIGFFLHIPFPSYEVFRLLPSLWRKEILEGLFGADLIGFHTFEYRTYFLRSTLSILGLTEDLGEVLYKGRLVKVDTFPMGIDYERYNKAALSKSVASEVQSFRKNINAEKIILSIDRQDYSKGILNRLKAYQYFLETNPSYQTRVSLILVVIPSRIGLVSYQSIKSQIDELVGNINGHFGSIAWLPIHYQYRSLTPVELSALYNSCDVALITPLRDGMNLIAKEFVASRTGNGGVLILSEMAGAASELDRAVVINPNNKEEISAAIITSLEMGHDEQEERIQAMKVRIKNYTVFKWVSVFLSELKMIKDKQQRFHAAILSPEMKETILADFKRAEERILFLDYDGTLVELSQLPGDANPDEQLYRILRSVQKKGTRIIIISGRERASLDKWFKDMPVDLIAEHGVYIKEFRGDWKLIKPVRKTWKKKIAPLLNEFVEKLPGSFVEEKEYALAYHYRNAEPQLAFLRIKELMNHLMNYTTNMDVQLVNGNKVLEVRSGGIDKGVAALHWLGERERKSDFILAIGDDVTDEDLFKAMPPTAYTLKVGMHSSYAKYNLESTKSVRLLLEKMGNS